MKLLPFLRKELSIRGKTRHSGRGFWMFESHTPMTSAEVHSRVMEKIEDWKARGLIESPEAYQSNQGVRYTIRFDKNKFEGNTKFGYFVPNAIANDEASNFIGSVA